MRPVTALTENLVREMIRHYIDSGLSWRAVRKEFDVAYSTLWNFVNNVHPHLKEEMKNARRARGHDMMDMVIEAAENASDAQRARAIGDITLKVATKLAPEDFSDRLDVSMQVQTLDLAEATQRAVTYKPLRDLGAVPKPQVIDVQSTPVLNPSDLKSDDDIDPFS